MPQYLLSLLLLSIAIYLMWMDVTFYLELQKLPVRNPNLTVTSYAYSPFSPITVKQLMLLNVVQVNTLISCRQMLILSDDSLLTSHWPTSQSTTPELPPMSPLTECLSLESCLGPQPLNSS